MTVALLHYLRSKPGLVEIDQARLVWRGPTAAAATDDDLPAGDVARSTSCTTAGWKASMTAGNGTPELVEAVHEWEGFEDALGSRHRRRPHVDAVEAAEVPSRLFELAAQDGGPSMSKALMREADREQFREFVIHRRSTTSRRPTRTPGRSPGSAGGPRRRSSRSRPTSTAPGVTEAHARGAVRATPMRGLGLDGAYGHYLARCPA